MFAPSGYCLIEQLEDALRSVLRETLTGPDYSRISQDDEKYMLLRMSANSAFESRLIKEVREATLNVLETLDTLSICAPDGLVLKISKSILTVRSEFLESRLISYAGDDHLKPFLFSDNWILRDGNHFRNLNPSNFEKSQMQRRIRDGEPDGMNRVYRFTEPFRPFIGWSLSFKAEEMPSQNSMRSMCLKNGELANKGRPEKQSTALQAFDAIFPNGRQGTPWKVVADAVSNAIEETISISTIKRAIKNGSKADQN